MVVRSSFVVQITYERFRERGGHLLTQVVQSLNTFTIGMLVDYNASIWAPHGRPWTVQATCNSTNVLEHHTSSAFMQLILALSASICKPTCFIQFLAFSEKGKDEASSLLL
jgi:hypothetical protein